jgi:hypothetical protein
MKSVVFEVAELPRKNRISANTMQGSNISDPCIDIQSFLT